eukprot:scpid36370/ scgid29843/ Pseudouridine-5&apos
MISRLSRLQRRVPGLVQGTNATVPACRVRARCFSTRQPSSSVFRVSEEVQDALATGKPVVALETAIVTHGMPEPHNIDVAHMVEGRVRADGSVPATVGLLDGQVVVGLTAQELKLLAGASREGSARKVSRRDLAIALAEKVVGGTTVSATMMAAHWAGIHVFVTGGIGGVHRDGENSLDVSADLTELGRTPVAVVCAGCKSILDIGRTLEYLETQGVPTITLGQQKNFPAFFAPDSGFMASHTVSSAEACAQIIDSSLSLGLESGIVIGVPIPSEDGKAVDSAIQQALQEAKDSNVAGRDVTPFVLRRVNELSTGKSLAANIELIKNNASTGSQIAVELSRLRATGSTCGGGSTAPSGGAASRRHPVAGTAKSYTFPAPSSASPAGSAEHMTFGSQAPSVPGLFSQRGIDGEAVSFGNAPLPAEFTSNSAGGTASSIDQEITAEFEELVPRHYRQAPHNTGTSLPPNQPARHYHTSATLRHPAANACTDTDADQQLLDDKHFSERCDDYRLSSSVPCPVVVGAAVVDVVARPTDSDIKLRLTNNCQVSTCFGGVGRNVYEAMCRCGQTPLFISAVGADESSASLLQHIDSFVEDNRWSTVGIRPCAQHSTATYMAVLQQNGDLFTGIGSFDVMQRISPSWLARFDQQISTAPIVVIDSNMTEEAIACVLTKCRAANVPVWFEPTCTAKAAKIYGTDVYGSVTIASPNLAELQSMARACVEATGLSVDRETSVALAVDVSTLTSLEERSAACLELASILLAYHACLLVTLDKHGVLLIRRLHDTDEGDDSTSLWDCLKFYAQEKANDDRDCNVESRPWRMGFQLYGLPAKVDDSNIVSVSGAGDSLVGGVLAAMLGDKQLTITDSMKIGLQAARTSLPVAEAINPNLSMAALQASEQERC